MCIDECIATTDPEQLEVPVCGNLLGDDGESKALVCRQRWFVVSVGY